MSYSRVAFVADDSPQAEDALKSLTKAYGQNDVKKADVVVALGGDGFMLEALHTHMDKNVPIFGMHRGTIGFLMNKYDEQDLFERLNQAEEMVFHPLRMTALTSDGISHDALAINEVSMLRQTVLPIGSDILALTPISAFRPRRWRGAILPHTAMVRFVILNPEKRPVSAVADREEVRDVVEVTVREDRSIGMKMLFDPEHNLEERIIAEQFQP